MLTAGNNSSPGREVLERPRSGSKKASILLKNQLSSPLSTASTYCTHKAPKLTYSTSPLAPTTTAILSLFSYIVVKAFEAQIVAHEFHVVVFGEFAITRLFARNILRALGVHK